jgi:hypothetical protein
MASSLCPHTNVKTDIGIIVYTLYTILANVPNLTSFTVNKAGPHKF